MVFHNVAAFFLTARSQRPSDPEKGRSEVPIPPSPVARNHDDGDFTDDRLGPPTGTTLVEDDKTRGSQDSLDDDDDDDDHMAIDDEQDTNTITQELEREEHPEDFSTLHHGSSRPHVPFSTFPTVTSTIVPSTCYGRFWAKVKAFTNTSTSNEDLESYVPRYRHLPILSGIIIPFSILLEIPGLTEHWYISTVNNTMVDTKPNTLILVLGLSFSLACSIIANICLFLRFMEKKVMTTTLLCVAFLTIHGMYKLVTVLCSTLLIVSFWQM